MVADQIDIALDTIARMVAGIDTALAQAEAAVMKDCYAEWEEFNDGESDFFGSLYDVETEDASGNPVFPLFGGAAGFQVTLSATGRTVLAAWMIRRMFRQLTLNAQTSILGIGVLGGDPEDPQQRAEALRGTSRLGRLWAQTNIRTINAAISAKAAERVIRKAAAGKMPSPLSGGGAADESPITEVWIAVLDKHTTPFCRSMNGTEFAVGEGPYPPAHEGCRSLRVAIWKKWK